MLEENKVIIISSLSVFSQAQLLISWGPYKSNEITLKSNQILFFRWEGKNQANQQAQPT